MGDQVIQRDWEKEYLDTFTKKVPFPIIRHEIARINPAIESVVYTMTTVSINKDVKFELYTQSDTYNQLYEIKTKLTDERNNKASKKVEEVKETKKSSKDVVKIGSDLIASQQNSVQPEVPIVEDLTELALNMLEDNRAEQNKEEEKKRQSNKKEAEAKKEALKRREEEKKKDEAKKKETDKKKESDNKKEENKDKMKVSRKLKDESEEDDSEEEDDKKKNKKEEPHDDQNEGEEDKEKEQINSSIYDYLYMQSFPVEDTFYQNLKRCKKILTMWEITSQTYKKRKEIYIYDNIQTNIQFSKNGAYLMLNSSDSKTIYIYDAHKLTEVSKVTLTAKDTYGNEISYFYIFNLSFDGSYILASDYSNWYIFTNKGEYVKTIQTRGQTTVYHFSKSEFLILQFPEYTNTNIVAVDFLKDTERILYKATGYMYMFYLSDD